MILVIVNVSLKAEKQADFINCANPCLAATRQESGCASYELSINHANPNQLTFVEEWHSQDDLNSHMQSEHFLSFIASIKDLLAKPLNVNIYQADKL